MDIGPKAVRSLPHGTLQNRCNEWISTNMTESSTETYLRPGTYIDSDHPQVVEFANFHADGLTDDSAKAVRLYYAVRDRIAYTPYWDFDDREIYKASHCLLTGKGMCQSKSALLAAAARIMGIPARIGFADVINHMSSQKFIDLIGTDIFHWHSYTDLYLDGKWVKATPAFDEDLCGKFSVAPLDFNGTCDSLFQAVNAREEKFMEYVGDHGTFPDTPVERIQADFKTIYGGAFGLPMLEGRSLHDEVEAEKAAPGPDKKTAP